MALLATSKLRIWSLCQKRVPHPLKQQVLGILSIDFIGLHLSSSFHSSSCSLLSSSSLLSCLAFHIFFSHLFIKGFFQQGVAFSQDSNYSTNHKINFPHWNKNEKKKSMDILIGSIAFHHVLQDCWCEITRSLVLHTLILISYIRSLWAGASNSTISVSYTHLTLPTKLEV